MIADLGPSDFKDFLLKNNIIVTAAAITIGIASASFIKSFVSGLLMPLFYLVIGKLILRNVHDKLYNSVSDIFGDKADFNVDGFIRELITWVFIVFGAYILMDFIIRRWVLRATEKERGHGPAANPALVSANPYVNMINNNAH